MRTSATMATGPRVWRGLAPILAIVVVVGLAAGCSNNNSSNDNASSSNNGFHVSTPDGQVSVSFDGHLPPNWPTDFPVPDGAEVAGSGSVGNATTHMVAVYKVRGSGPDTLSFYESNSQLTTSDHRSAGAGSAYVGTLRLDTPFTGSVTVASYGSTTYLVVVLTSPSGTTTTTTSTTS